MSFSLQIKSLSSYKPSFSCKPERNQAQPCIQAERLGQLTSIRSWLSSNSRNNRPFQEERSRFHQVGSTAHGHLARENTSSITKRQELATEGEAKKIGQPQNHDQILVAMGSDWPSSVGANANRQIPRQTSDREKPADQLSPSRLNIAAPI